ncbi:MAG: cellulase family glycosylhydrolase [Oscillospiraceae bacterium]|nr:cellulase family glycosylhydrolase [Oscillospiraceae bacterium]
MKAIKIVTIFVTVLSIFFGLVLSTKHTTDYDGYAGYLKVDGTKVVDENGKEFIIKAMGFSNYCMNYPSSSASIENYHHTEASYAELAEMGFNTVRFLINYNLFEDDSRPYTYKQSGFNWIDKNIAWAKKYGLRIIIDMHCPQGGYQSWDQTNTSNFQTKPDFGG